MYIPRTIDKYLISWKENPDHKPLLLRGARQVGKSTAVDHLGEQFDTYVKINFERNPEYASLFESDLGAERIVSGISALSGKKIVPGTTLLFFDEIQECQRAIMSLRFFKEELPALHVVTAGSLLEFALDELPTFGTGRIHSMWMYPLSFDEFAAADGYGALVSMRDEASADKPLLDVFHDKLVELYRAYLIVGGMPAVVKQWIATHDFLACQQEQDDIVTGYESDFPKYRRKVDPELLRSVLRAASHEAASKFVYAKVRPDVRAAAVKSALDLLVKAGLLVPVVRTSANGLPLGAEADLSDFKILVMDTGLMLRILSVSYGDSTRMNTQILTGSVSELVNRGPLAEMSAGLEMVKYSSPNIRKELFYWSRQAKNSVAEIDYVTAENMTVVPIEVKAGTQGGMKSLWAFMQDKDIARGIRCSLENFGVIKGQDSTKRVDIIPLYALSMLGK